MQRKVFRHRGSDSLKVTGSEVAVLCKLQHLVNPGHSSGPGHTEMNEHSAAVRGTACPVEDRDQNKSVKGSAGTPSSAGGTGCVPANPGDGELLQTGDDASCPLLTCRCPWVCGVGHDAPSSRAALSQ